MILAVLSSLNCNYFDILNIFKVVFKCNNLVGSLAVVEPKMNVVIEGFILI